MNTPFEAKVYSEQGVAVLELHGEINAFADLDLSAAYTQAEGLGKPVIVLDFSRVSYINSTGIGLIVSLLQQARQHDRRLVAFGLSDHYREIFQITRLDEYITLFSDREEALAAG